MIEKIVWHLGTYTEPALIRSNPFDFYQFERSQNTGKSEDSSCNLYPSLCTDLVGRTTLWRGFVGLMYPSDFYFGTGGINRDVCIQEDNSQFIINECEKDNWMYKSEKSQWTITSGIYTYTNALNTPPRQDLPHCGNVLGSCGEATHNYLVIPVIYLASNISIISGTGTKEDSYKLELKEGI